MPTTSTKFKRLPLDADILGAELDHKLSGRVARQLLELIARHFSPKLRLPPIRQIADELGVSVGTANQAIKQLVNDGILVSKQRAGTVIAPGCTRAHVQRRLDGSGDDNAISRLIRVLLRIDCDEMTQEMADSFARTIVDRGSRVQFHDCPRGLHRTPLPQDDSDATAMFQPQSASMPILWSAPTPLIVVCTDHIDVDSSDPFDIVSVDDEHGAYLAGRRFRDSGHECVCFVGRRDKEKGDRIYGTLAQRRLRGFERGWGQAIPEDCRLFTGSHDLHNGARTFGQYIKLSPRPDGVFCATDDLAIGFHIGAFTQDMCPGHDFSLIGFDKQHLGETIPAGPLTTVEVPRQEIGKRAAELLLDRLANPDQPVRRITLGCTLFEGATLMDQSTSRAKRARIDRPAVR